jgi:putative PIN family toxin of toxin-antitoxin system
MLKAVIDTSVFISGLVKSPSCRRIIKALEKSEFILVISPDILDELIGVMSRPKFNGVIQRDTAARLIEVIKGQALLVKPAIKLNVVTDDPDDNRFLEAAVTAKANCVVSLDRHLLELNAFRNIPVISPAKFFSLLAKSK